MCDIEETQQSSSCDETEKEEKIIRTSRSFSDEFAQKMKDIFLSLVLFVFVTILTHGLYGPSPFVLPSIPNQNEGLSPAGNPSKLKVQPTAPPLPFFEADSAVDDFYGGDVYAAFAEADRHENALLFYYAPWDADSRAVRDVLELIGDVFADSDLYIGAINCWIPTGECYKQFGQNANASVKGTTFNPRLIHNQFPILVFYPRDRNGIQYHGPLTLDSLIEFLLSARNPIYHLRSRQDLLELQARHSGRAVVGYFPNVTTDPGARKSLRQFVSSAYHLLESDPFRVQSGGFGAVTSQKLAYNLHLAPTQSVRQYFWNGTSIAYPNKTIASTAFLTNWITSLASEEPLTSWVGVIGRKSQALSGRLLSGTGNSLVVFTPRTNRFLFNEALSIVQEASILYKSCQSIDDKTKSLIDTIRTLRKESSLKYETLLDTCSRDPWYAKMFENRPFCQYLATNSICSSLVRSNLSIASLNSQQKIFIRRRPTLGKPLFDPFVDDMVRMHNRLECTLAHAASSSDPSCTFEDVKNLDLNISGLGCQDNKTLNFFTLDYISQRGLAKTLGLNEDTIEALIVVPSKETYYHMNDKFSLENLSKFIENFHRNEDHLKAAKLTNGSLTSSKVHLPKSDSSSLHLSDLTRDFFLRSSNDSDKPLVLLYLGSSCGFCWSAVRAFHTVQRILNSKPEPFVHFSTINTSINDLPWSFTAFTTPTVIYVPPGSDTASRFHSESRVFPSHMSINVTNLMTFLAANLPQDLRLDLLQSLTDPKGKRSTDETFVGENGFENSKDVLVDSFHTEL